jgi:CheY-like chemotaxis protein
MLPVMIVHAISGDERRVHPRGPSSDVTLSMPNLNGVHVVAVDDDEDALTLVHDILETAGAQVTTVASAPAALKALEHAAADVLIADIGMSGMDGYELIAQIRKSSLTRMRAIPAAALTAYARSEDRAKALRLGFQMHLAKPIDPNELMAAVAALANRNIPE